MPPIYEATEDLGIPPTPKGHRLELSEAQAKPYGKSLKKVTGEATKVQATDPAADAEKAQAKIAADKKAADAKAEADRQTTLAKAEEDRKAAAASEAEMAGMSAEERKAAGEKITAEAQAKAQADAKAAAEKKAAAAAAKKAAEEETRKAAAADDLTKIKGISDGRQSELNGENIFTYQQLIDADPVKVAMLIKGANAGTVRGWQDQAQALKE